MKKLFVAVISIALIVLLSFGSFALDVDLTHLNTFWYYTTDYNTYYSYGTSQLTSSMLVGGSDTYFRVNRYYDPDLDSLGDFVQVDFYFVIGAASPNIPSSIQSQAPLYNLRTFNRFVNSDATVQESYLVRSPYLSYSVSGGSTSFTLSYIYNRGDFVLQTLTHPVNGNKYLMFFFDVNPIWVNTLSSSTVLMFSSIRVTATDQISSDDELSLQINNIIEDMNSGFLTLSEGQQAIEDAIQSSQEEAHQDALDIQSGISEIGDLIYGDGSFGSPESGPIRDLDEHLLAEEEFADDFGFDSYFNDDFLVNLMDEADWENIDTPTQASAFWVHKILNPIMDAFPVFVIFPLIIGLVATFLGRRYQL